MPQEIAMMMRRPIGRSTALAVVAVAVAVAVVVLQRSIKDPVTTVAAIVLPETLRSYRQYAPPPNHIDPQSTDPHPQQSHPHRRSFVQTAVKNTFLQIAALTTVTSTTGVSAATSDDDTHDNANDDDDEIVRIVVTDPTMKLGLELSNHPMDDSDSSTTASPTTIVVVERIVTPSSQNANVQEGMRLLHYSDAKHVSEQLRKTESYPITLLFQKPPKKNQGTATTEGLSAVSQTVSHNDRAYHIVQISPARATRTGSTMDHGSNGNDPLRRSQRGDVLAIIYQARIDSPTGRIYDASDQRGTGQQPYQMVLGSGDMILGVDQGLYDMGLDEIRGTGPVAIECFRSHPIPISIGRYNWYESNEETRYKNDGYQYYRIP